MDYRTKRIRELEMECQQLAEYIKTLEADSTSLTTQLQAEREKSERLRSMLEKWVRSGCGRASGLPLVDETEDLLAQDKGENAGWIAVEDELPDERVLVLLSCFENQVGVGHWCEGVWYTPEPQVVCGTDVTHWMPLPEPPQDKVGIGNRTRIAERD